MGTTNAQDERLRIIARELLENGPGQRDHRLDGPRQRPRPAGVLVKRILRKYGYPPDKQERATRTVLEQAELICAAVGLKSQSCSGKQNGIKKGGENGTDKETEKVLYHER